MSPKTPLQKSLETINPHLFEFINRPQDFNGTPYEIYRVTTHYFTRCKHSGRVHPYRKDVHSWKKVFYLFALNEAHAKELVLCLPEVQAERNPRLVKWRDVYTVKPVPRNQIVDILKRYDVLEVPAHLAAQIKGRNTKMQMPAIY